jgi:hypothetical protein
MGRNYPRLDILTFGRHLLESGDLDPLYIALAAGFDDHRQLSRFLIAYWCFYSAGFASWASEREGPAFWLTLRKAALNLEPTPFGARWPRGHERRHARGDQGVRMVGDLQHRYGAHPERFVERLVEAAPNYEKVAATAQDHRLFGPWISFKIADMLDRVLGVNVDFSEAAVFMFKDPTKAALMLWRQHHGLPETARPKDQNAVIHEVVAYLKGQFADQLAPPLRDRPVDLQEVETVLCKWKSHMNGHYPLNNDIGEIRDGLLPWVPYAATASVVLGRMPKELVHEHT